MTFAQHVKELSGSLGDIEEVKNMLTPEMLSLLRSIRAVDLVDLERSIRYAKQIEQKSDSLETISEGLGDIEEVVDMQLDIQNVSSMRSAIGLVAAMKSYIKHVISMEENINTVYVMEDMLKSILAMQPDIESVMDMKGEIEATNFIAENMRDDMLKIEKQSEYIKSALADMRSMKDEVVLARRTIELKLAEIRIIEKGLHEFKVKTFSIEPDRKGYSKYEEKTNTLNLFIPRGKRGFNGETGNTGRRGQRGISGYAVEKGDTGEKGEPGINGKDFNIGARGKKNGRNKYGNMPVGFSYLSLDESPVMIYFRKSNSLNDWSSGQPFGTSDSDIFIKALDSEKLNGFTANDLIKHIEQNVKKLINKKDINDGTS